jgi:hypothetical protein
VKICVRKKESRAKTQRNKGLPNEYVKPAYIRQGAKKKSLCGLAPLRAKNKISRRRKVQACFFALTIRRGGQAPRTREKSA